MLRENTLKEMQREKDLLQELRANDTVNVIIWEEKNSELMMENLYLKNKVREQELEITRLNEMCSTSANRSLDEKSMSGSGLCDDCCPPTLLDSF